MKWLEVIELRSSGTCRAQLESYLTELISAVVSGTNPPAVIIYNRVSVSGDFGIHLRHTSGPLEKNGSRLGLQLADALREYGLVNHRIWLELPVPS